MPEPLDPLAAGVASVLKGLRMRAGLHPGRVGGIGLALDTLTGLDNVQEHVAAGETVEQAIVSAVSDAAGQLEPTHSIVADVSLGLRLSAGPATDPELYASDLGRRREALLRNWGRLHEARQARAGPAPALRALRLEVETEALSDLALTLTQPDRQRASAAAGPAPAARRPRPPLAGPSAPLASELGRMSAALRAALAGDGGTRGWPHDLRPGSRPATPLSTAFGLRAMLALDGFLASDMKPVAEWLQNEAGEDGGYFARSQRKPRPEGTATVLGTLHLINGTASYSKQIDVIKNNLTDFERTRPYILTTVLDAITRVGSDHSLMWSLAGDLLAARREYGEFRLWPEKAEPGLADPEPSYAHTARAIAALARLDAPWAAGQAPSGLAGQARQAVTEAAGWLAGRAERADLGNVSENIDRQVAAGVEQVYVRHFTSAWVVKALISAGYPASHPAVIRALRFVWERYSADTGLWRWRNGDLPVWMTLDGIEALRLAALSTTVPSGAPGVD